ncbi:hypothetical protein [Burkholderia oklahomensis]|uniref:hypothetical protein n=1 Tax=Burkholderia oklahomensis TaxID=342113 RepID=UPI000A645EAE|nr:hypothetical protein [Burkholderia oklahomensis]
MGIIFFEKTMRAAAWLRAGRSCLLGAQGASRAIGIAIADFILELIPVRQAGNPGG